jgi:hypothetical protein
MPPRQVEKPLVKQQQVNHKRVDSVEMPPRSGGKLPSKPFNSGRQKNLGGSTVGKQYQSNAIMDVRNQPPILHQSYGSSYTNPSYQSRPHTGGPIRNERMTFPRGTPYNIPPPSQVYPSPRASMPAPSFGHQQRFPAATSTVRNGGRSNTSNSSFSSSRGNNNDFGTDYLKITVSDDSDSVVINKNYSEPSSDIQKRLEALEVKQQLLLKELEANKKGLKIKDNEIEKLSQTIEDQKSKLNRRDETRSSNNNNINNNNNSQNDQYNYRVSNRNDYDDDGEEMHDATPTVVGTGSINAMFAKARNQVKPI